MPMMQASQGLELLLTDAFLASITGMVMQGDVGISEPTMQGFGINAQESGRLGNRENGHGRPPFRGRVQDEHTEKGTEGKLPGKVPETLQGSVQGRTDEADVLLG
jgi:hypothetical protein